MKAASSENRNATIAAMSPGAPRRDERTEASIWLRYSSFVFMKAASVRVNPGATRLQRTSCLPPRGAVRRVRRTSPLLGRLIRDVFWLTHPNRARCGVHDHAGTPLSQQGQSIPDTV